MTAILASYVKMSTLVDGTMRVVLDIEPTAAADAFRLLGSPGTPIALARLTNEAAQKASETPAAVAGQEGGVSPLGLPEGGRPAAPPSAPERKPLTLPQKVALACQNPQFWRFLKQTYRFQWEQAVDAFHEAGDQFSQEDITVVVVRDLCNVRSRKEIREGTTEGRDWLNIEATFHDWQRRAA